VAGAWASAGAALWLASLGSLAAVSIAEGVAAAIAAALAALAAALGGRAVSLPDAGRGAVGDRATPLARRAPVPVRWPLLARLPVTVLTDTGRVFAQATRGSRTGALRVVDLDAAGSGSEAARGRAVATLLLGVTPGTYVTDVERSTGRVSVHALVPPSRTEHALTAGRVTTEPAVTPDERGAADEREAADERRERP
jgi:hypothetical protein